MTITPMLMHILWLTTVIRRVFELWVPSKVKIKVPYEDLCIYHRDNLTPEALRYGSHSFYAANTPYLS